MDFHNKVLASRVYEMIHPDYCPIDLKNSERPDIHYVKQGVGLEVTRAFSKEEGLFYSDARGNIKDRDKMLDIISTGHAQIIEDTEVIIDRIVFSINKKTELVSGYLKENSWIKRLALAVIIGYDLECYDFDVIASKISSSSRRRYPEILFIMPSYSYLYDKSGFTRICYEL